MEETCSICLEEIHDQKTRVYPCSHTFHQACLSEWRTTLSEKADKITCPNCRGLDVEANRPLLSEHTPLLTDSETADTQVHTTIRNTRIQSFCKTVYFYGIAIISGFIFVLSAYLLTVLFKIWFN